MKVEGSYTFNAPREEVWSALLDPEVLGRVLPGGQELERVAENQYKAKMKIKVGPVQGVFSGSVNLSDLNPHHVATNPRQAERGHKAQFRTHTGRCELYSGLPVHVAGTAGIQRNLRVDRLWFCRQRRRARLGLSLLQRGEGSI